jgi:hypothetical protein
MNKILSKNFFVKQVFLAVITTAFISAGATANPTTKTFNNSVHSFAKTNPANVRKNTKQKQQRVGGSYKTEALIKSATNQTQTQTTNANSKQQPRIRAQKKALQLSKTAAFGFEVYDASVFLIGDQDNDGFYSNFEIDMDVDVDSGSANVYAEIFYLNSNGEWQYLSSTEVFPITGNLASDSYTTAITLVDGFADNYYDLLIDIYEDGIPGIVATIEAANDTDLEFVPLEDLTFDATINPNQLFLDSLSMTLFNDYDSDGFYSEFGLEISLQNETFGRRLQAILYSRDTVTNFILETSTASVFVNRSETVTFNINGNWNTGYVTDYYDFLVEIVDADTGEVVDDYGPEYNLLFERPMESNDFDVPGETVIIVEESYSSGSSDLMIMLLLSLALIFRVSKKSNTKKQLYSK